MNNTMYAWSGGSTQTGYEKYIPGSGIGWKINLINGFEKDGVSYASSHHKGWGKVKIGKAHATNNGFDSSSAVGRYFHKQMFLSGELGFGVGSSGPTVSISSSWGYDASQDRGAQWDWYHKDY